MQWSGVNMLPLELDHFDWSWTSRPLQRKSYLHRLLASESPSSLEEGIHAHHWAWTRTKILGTRYPSPSPHYTRNWRDIQVCSVAWAMSMPPHRSDLINLASLVLISPTCQVLTWVTLLRHWWNEANQTRCWRLPGCPGCAWELQVCCRWTWDYQMWSSTPLRKSSP